MGASQSASCGSGIHVGTTRTAYESGDHVDGKVYVYVTNEIQVDCIQLRLVGESTCIWREEKSMHEGDNEGESHHRVETLIFKGREQILDVMIPIHSPQGSAGLLGPGQFEWPFQLQLPSNLPGSMHYTLDPDARADVTYTLRATCVTRGWASHNLVSEQEIVVYSGFPPSSLGQSEEVRTEEHGDVNCCCCYNKGRIDASATISNAIVTPGGVSSLTFSAKNESSVPITKVRLKLTQEIMLRGHLVNVCRGARARYILNSSSHFRANGLDNYDYSACRRHRHMRYNRYREHTHTMKTVLSRADAPGCGAFEDIQHRQMTIMVPPQCLATTYTGVVHCTHQLKVTASTGLFINDVTVRTPMTVAVGHHQSVFSPFHQRVLANAPGGPTADGIPLTHTQTDAPSAPEWGGMWAPVIGNPVVLNVPEPSAPPLPEIMNANIQQQQQQQQQYRTSTLPPPQSRNGGYQEIPKE